MSRPGGGGGPREGVQIKLNKIWGNLLWAVQNSPPPKKKTDKTKPFFKKKFLVGQKLARKWQEFSSLHSTKFHKELRSSLVCKTTKFHEESRSEFLKVLGFYEKP